jgi:hypothetical protein
LTGKEVGDKLIGEQILCECRKIKGPVLIHRGAHRAQRYVLQGFPAKVIITKKWRITE